MATEVGVVTYSDDWLTILQGDCRAVLIDLNADYIRQQMARNAQVPVGL